jgi:hypothetical protein
MVNSHITPTKKLREFGLLLGAIFPVLFGILLPWLFDHDIPYWPWIISAIFVIWALAWPEGLKPVQKYWNQFGNILGWINSRIILGALFFILITPFGLIMRLVGHDPMSRKIDPKLKSYRVPSTAHDNKYMERPF